MKFFSILKKELREMLNMQMILMLVFLVVVMYSMSGFVDSAIDESMEESAEIVLCDKDNTEFSKSVIRFIEHPTAESEADNEVKLITLESDDYAAELKRLDKKSFVIIPEGFTDKINSGEQAELIYVSKMTSFSTMSNMNAGSETAVAYIEAAVKSAIFTNKVQLGKLSENEVTQINSPITIKENTIVGDKSSEISQMILYSSVFGQTLLLPLVVYMLILLGSQSMINAVTAEKLDKTLETLLSAPVSRLSVLSAKMLAAAIVALINAAVYMVGMNNMTTAASGAVPDEYKKYAAELGISFGLKYYLLIGIQMLLSTLIALSLAMILGAFAKNVKSSQTLLMPILFLTIIPFMAAEFIDISSLPGAIKYLLYAIPFTHTFMASDTVTFSKTSLYVGGLIYQAVFLMICVIAAIKIFTTDKIVTASENTSSRRKRKKHSEN